MNRQFRVMTGVNVALVFALGACGSSAQSGIASSSGAGLTANARAAVTAAYAGTSGEPPATSPRPQPGKNVWVVTLSAQLTDYSAPGQIMDAGKLLGWNMTLFDGQYNPDTVVSGLRQAIADKADGIIVTNVDCPVAKAGLEDVQKAGIPVVAIESFDCNLSVDQQGATSDSGEPGLFDAEVMYANPDDPKAPLSSAEMWGQVWTKFQLLGIAEATGGKAKIVKMKETDTSVTLIQDAGFEAAMAKYCPGCEVVDTVDFVGSDFGGGIQSKVEQALAQHPEANAVYGVYDAAALEAAPAVLASGRSADIYVMAGEGTAAAADLIREGRGLSAGVGFSARWEGWSALDALNRLFNGEVPDGIGFPSGNGTQLYDREHNLPAKGQRYEGPVDFEAAYRAAWGIS